MIFRRAYDWVLGWSQSRYAVAALFVLAIAEASFFPIPPDVLLIAMVLSTPARWISYASVCLTGSVLGGLLGYAIGYGLWQVVSGWFFHYVFSEDLFHKVQELYQRYDFWAVFTAGLTPIPYKVFTIAGGVAQINLATFSIASVLSRGARFFMVAFLLKWSGPAMKTFIDRYFNYLSILFVILLIGGFVLINHLLK